MLGFLRLIVFALVASLGIASGAHAFEAKPALRAFSVLAARASGDAARNTAEGVGKLALSVRRSHRSISFNRFRYYDAEAGGYTQQDPIRVRGGLALYAYVGNPLRATDWSGLNPSVIALGLQNTRETVTIGNQTFTGMSKDTLDRFARKKGASTWTSFDKIGTLDQNIRKAMDDSSTIHFNLQGMTDDSVKDIIAKPDPSRFSPGSTNGELATVLSNEDLKKKTQFWEGPDVKSKRCT